MSTQRERLSHPQRVSLLREAKRLNVKLIVKLIKLLQDAEDAADALYLANPHHERAYDDFYPNATWEAAAEAEADWAKSDPGYQAALARIRRLTKLSSRAANREGRRSDWLWGLEWPPRGAWRS